MYEGDYEHGLLSEVDVALTKALTAIGLLSIHGEVAEHRDHAIEALRELCALMESGEIPFIGCARLAVEIVDDYAERAPASITEPYFDDRQKFTYMFDEDVMPSIEGMDMPTLRLVGEDDEDEYEDDED